MRGASLTDQSNRRSRLPKQEPSPDSGHVITLESEIVDGTVVPGDRNGRRTGGEFLRLANFPPVFFCGRLLSADWTNLKT